MEFACFISFLLTNFLNPFLSCVPFIFLPLNTIFMWKFFDFLLFSSLIFSSCFRNYWWITLMVIVVISRQSSQLPLLHLCSRISTCYICSQWSDNVWILAEKRRTHATRRSIMTKKRDSKTKKRNVPDLSDTISIDGSTAPHGFTARGRTHLGGQPYGIVFQQGNKSTSHRSTSHRSTSHPVVGQPAPVNKAPVTGHRSFRY